MYIIYTRRRHGIKIKQVPAEGTVLAQVPAEGMVLACIETIKGPCLMAKMFPRSGTIEQSEQCSHGKSLAGKEAR